MDVENTMPTHDEADTVTEDRENKQVKFSSDIEPSVAREHYSKLRKIYQELPIGEVSPILNSDHKIWCVSGDNDLYDPNFQSNRRLTVGDERHFSEVRKPISAKNDFEVAIDHIERTMYATTSYKTDEVLSQWTPAQYDPESDSYVSSIRGNILPSWQDTAGIMIIGYLELAEEYKYRRDNFNRETRDIIKQIFNAYGNKYAKLYACEDAIFGLDCLEGAYIIGAPTATLDIYQHYHNIVQDPIASGMIFEELVKRSNKWLKETEQEVNKIIECSDKLVNLKQINGPIRFYKAPLSIHNTYDIVVTPFNPTDVEYEITRLEDVDSDLIQETIQWVRNLNHDSHRNCVDSLVANLWPTEYSQEGDWKAALEKWIRDKRYKEAKKREDERKSREDRVKNRTDQKITITQKYTDEHHAIENISTEEIIRLYACDDWDIGIDISYYIEFNPSWRSSKRGSACTVNTKYNVFGDSGMNGSGDALRAMALGSRNIAYWDPSDDLEGEIRGEALDALREAGYEVPLFVPDVGSDKRNGDGKHDQTPLWAKLDAAVALGLCEEDDFIQVDHEDKGETYHKLPDDVNAELSGILRNEYGYTVSHIQDKDESKPTDNSDDLSGTKGASVSDLGDVLGEDAGGKSTGDHDVDGEDQDDEEDGIARFLTYEEPGDVDDDFDLDRDAVRQFVDEFCEVDLEAGDDLVIHKSDVFDAFMQWSEINLTDLDNLSQDAYQIHAKGFFNNILEKEYELEDGKHTIGGNRKISFVGISLSELGQELLSIS